MWKRRRGIHKQWRTFPFLKPCLHGVLRSARSSLPFPWLAFEASPGEGTVPSQALSEAGLFSLVPGYRFAGGLAGFCRASEQPNRANPQPSP